MKSFKQTTLSICKINTNIQAKLKMLIQGALNWTLIRTCLRLKKCSKHAIFLLQRVEQPISEITQLKRHTLLQTIK